jgi:gas vesicle protein
MKDDKGKVIFLLLAGATAGIVTGLLLAPETGESARANLRRSASKWGDDLGKLFKGGSTADEPGHVNREAIVPEDKDAADALMQRMSASAPSTNPNDANFDSSANPNA